MLKVLHTGDIHLGDLNGPVINGRNARRDDTLRAIDALVERARIERARIERPDVSIIAGDIINRSRVWADTALEDVNDIIVRLLRPIAQVSHLCFI